MATYCERDAQSVDHMSSLCFDYLLVLLFPVLVLRAEFWVLIAPIPGHCIRVSFKFSKTP